MKFVKTMSIALLVFLLFLTGCEQRILQAEGTETEETDWEEIFPFRDFPTESETETHKGETTTIPMEDSIFRAKFEGNKVAGSGEVVDGVYRFIATKTDREAWHVKLECNYPTVAGRDYFVTYKFNSNVAGKVKFGDFQEFQIKKGENSITGVMIATGGTSYLDLQLGMLSPFTIDFTEIEVKEYEDEATYENALPVPINFERESLVYEKHDSGYTTILIRRDDTVNVNYLSAPLDSGVWKSRLYIKTGLIPEPGVRYRITADAMCDEDMPFEILFNNGDEEKGYGALYDQKLTANEVKKIQAVMTGNGNVDELILQVSLGESPDGSKVVFGNVKIDKIIDNYTSVLSRDFKLDESTWTGRYINRLIPVAFKDIPLDLSYESIDTVYEQHDDGYVVELEKSASNAFLKIKQAPAKAEDRGVWKVRLYADTGVSLSKGKTYLVKYDLVSNVDQADYEACFDGNKENAYGALYGRSLKGGVTDHVERLITPESSGGPLTLRLQLGKTDTAKGNKFLLSGLSVEEVQVEEYTNIPLDDFSYETTYTNVLPSDFSYDTGVNVTEWHVDGYAQNVSAAGDSATLNITEAPSEGREVWKSKLFIDTGATLKEGKKYRISTDLSATSEFPYEICYNDGGIEKGAGNNGEAALYGLTASSAASTETYDLIPETDKHLVIQFSVGNAPSGTSVTVSNIKVAELVPGDETESVLPESFKYPKITTVEPDAEGYVPVVLSDLSYWEQHGGTFVQSVEGSSLKIEQVQGIWESKLFAGTGIALEAGNRYRITANVSSEKAIDQFEICYNKGTEEKGYGALYDQKISAGQTASFVNEFEVPADASAGELVLQFQLGRSPMPNTFTINDVKIEKYVPGYTEKKIVPEAYEECDIKLGVREEHDDDYDQSLSGMTLTIRSVSGDPGVWKSKLFVDTGASLESGKKYKVSANVTSDKAIDDFEVTFDKGGEEKAFGALYEKNIGNSESKLLEGEITAGDSGNLTLRFQLGKSPAENTFTVNSVKLEEFVPEHEEEVEVGESYENIDTSVTVWEQHGEAFVQSVEGFSLKIRQEQGVWESKLFVGTGTALEAGAKYRVTAEFTSNEETDFEICYNNGETEKGYGALYGQKISAGQTASFTNEFEVPADASAGELVLQFQLGRSPMPNIITVNSVKLEKYKESQDPAEILDPGSFELWTSEGNTVALKGDGSKADVCFSSNGGLEVWKTKLFADTGVTLSAGKTYRISADVKAEQETSYEICYNDGGTEKGVGALYGLVADTQSRTVVFDATPANDASLIIQFSLGNAAEGNTVTVSNIKVEEIKDQEGENIMSDPLTTWAPIHSWMDGGYNGSLSNDDSSATLKLDSVAADQADWKVKLFVETGAELKEGKQYRISYKLKSDKDFDYNVFYNDGAEEKAVGEFYGLNTGTVKVEHTVIAPKDAVLTIQLMLGMSPVANNITISDVKVEEVDSSVSFWAHEDYTASLSGTGSSATLDIEKVPDSGREAWKIKLFAQTGVQLEAGKIYRISVDVESGSPMPYEICYNNGDAESELGSKGGLKAANQKQTVTNIIQPGKEAELTLQFNLGNASGANSFTISNIKVEEGKNASSKKLIPNFRYNSTASIKAAADEGYVTSLRRDDSSATFKIWRAPEERNPWNAKVNVFTGFTPESGKGYRVSVDIDSAKPQDLFEIFYDGDVEMAYGALYEQRLPEGNKTFSYIIYPGDSKGELRLQLRFGKTNDTGGDDYTIRNIKVEEVTFNRTSSPEIKNVSELVTQSGYNAELTKYPDKDVVRLIRTPKNGREAWKNKLFVNTGVTLEEGQKYRIKAVVKSVIPAPFEVCLNNGNIEKGLGGIFGLMSRPQGEYISYSAYVKEDIDLVVQLSLGNCVAPNTIVLSDVKVEKAGRIDLISDKIYQFR